MRTTDEHLVHFFDSVNKVSFHLQSLRCSETRALVRPQAGPSVCALSLTSPPRLDPRIKASTARSELTDPSYCHTEMQALLDAEMSDDDDDVPFYHGNNAANQTMAGNGLDQVVFSFQRQFMLSSPRRHNWPWSTSVAGVGSAESHSAAAPQTMFHEGGSSRGRHLSSGSAKIAGMPLHDESMLVSPVCRGETNPKTRDLTRDSNGSDTCGILSTEDLFGAISVCNMTDTEICENANKPCSVRPETSQPHNPREHQMSPLNVTSVHPVPSTSHVTDDTSNADVQSDGATFHGDIECVDVVPWKSDTSRNLRTEFAETKSVDGNEGELTDTTGSISSLHFSDVFTDLRGTETLLDCDAKVLPTSETIDPQNNTSTVREHSTHDWNAACIAGLSHGSDSDAELDRSTDTIETYMTDDSTSLEQSMRESTVSEDSASLASDLGHLFACEHDSDAMSSDNMSASDGSMTDRSASLISLQSGTTNSDSLVNDNTRNLFLMTDSAIRPRTSRRHNSPMGSVNSDSLINGQNRDLFTQSNVDDHTNQTGDDMEQIQSDVVQNESESAADDWYVYDERLTAELNSLRRLIDMRNYVRTQQHWETHGIIGPPPYEECPETHVAVTTAIAEIPDNPPPPYTEHTESLPPEYDQLSDHGVVAVDVHQRSSQRLHEISNSESETPTSDLNHVRNGNDELYPDHIVGCRTDDTSIDELPSSRGGRELELETVARRRSNDLDWSATRMASPGCNPPSYRRSLYSLGHHLPLRWNTVAGVNQWASSRLWASSRMPS